MDLASAKTIGAGLASIALIGAGVGIGIIFGNYLSGALRNPGAAQGQFTNLLVGFALCEFTGLHGVVMAFVSLFTYIFDGRAARNDRKHWGAGRTCRTAPDDLRRRPEPDLLDGGDIRPVVSGAVAQ